MLATDVASPRDCIAHSRGVVAVHAAQQRSPAQISSQRLNSTRTIGDYRVLTRHSANFSCPDKNQTIEQTKVLEIII